jgi:CubicO group peptidase (beta-lactamase class C family)
MKVFLKFLFFLFIVVFIACASLYLSGNSHLIKAVQSTYLVGKTGPTIDDYPKFINRKVAAKIPQNWPQHSKFNTYTLSAEEEALFNKWETSAFVVVQNREVLLEKYYDDYSKQSLTNSFSMAKSFTSLCIGSAIKEGKINSDDQLIGDFLPEYNNSGIRIKDLLQMSSGIDFGESYGDPFGFMAKAYYGTNVYDLTLSKKTKVPAGKEWKYQGGNTLLLSFIIEKATGKSLSNYFAEMFWQPLGASTDALWTIDKENGRERSYCCFYSNATDYAKVGQLMLDSGRWNGKQLIDLGYFNSSISPVNLPDESGSLIAHYGYQWWLGNYKGISFHYARGILGQYIVSVPEWNVVFVRLGKKRDPTRGAIIPSDLLEYFEVVERIKKSH